MGGRGVDVDQRDLRPSSSPPASEGDDATILVADVGTAMTRLTMVGIVAGAWRLIARVEGPSTVSSPDADAVIAIDHLVRQIEGITGRRLTPNGDHESDVPHADPYLLLVTTSAAATPTVAIMALAEPSAREAIHAAHGTYVRIVHTLSLDEAGTSDAGWMGQQLTALAAARPDVIFLTGGEERGAVQPVEQLAQLAALLTRVMRPIPWLLYAGNSAAAERARAMLGDVTVVPNLRPSATSNRLEPARAALRRLYAARAIPSLPGYDTLKARVAADVSTVADSQGVMVRFLAERYGRRIVLLDTGATHSTGHMQADGHFSQVVLAGLGLAHGAVGLLEEVGAHRIARWLPRPTSDSDVGNRLPNRAFHGNAVPTDGDDLLLDHAMLREAFAATVAALRSARRSMEYDLVIAAGAITRAPRPGLAALTLLDVLAMDDYRGTLAIDLYLDSLGLFAASGALARLHADAATCLLEQDGLNSGPLATVIVPLGAVVAGSPALDVELTTLTPEGTSETRRVTVLGGTIARLPLPRGSRGTLRIEPVSGVYVGANAPGQRVVTDEAMIIGSTMGLLIDARPRPLVLPADDLQRIAQLRTWLEALDAAPPDLDEPRARPQPRGQTPPIAVQDGTPESQPVESHADERHQNEPANIATETSEGPASDKPVAPVPIGEAPVLAGEPPTETQYDHHGPTVVGEPDAAGYADEQVAVSTLPRPLSPEGSSSDEPALDAAPSTGQDATLSSFEQTAQPPVSPPSDDASVRSGATRPRRRTRIYDRAERVDDDPFPLPAFIVEGYDAQPFAEPVAADDRTAPNAEPPLADASATGTRVDGVPARNLAVMQDDGPPPEEPAAKRPKRRWFW